MEISQTVFVCKNRINNYSHFSLQTIFPSYLSGDEHSERAQRKVRGGIFYFHIKDMQMKMGFQR